ncbi:MAG: hypothetical protein IRZ07_01995, partial [Microbispora sp.]|nr:hypothetical protein [Microbispora sp.]
TLSEKILYGELRPGHIVKVDVEGEGDNAKFVFTGELRSPAVPDSAASIAEAVQR